MPRDPARPASMARTVTTVAVTAVLLVAILIGLGWVRPALTSDSPYDEMFITINPYMPGFARDWGCGRIAERFPGTMPPHTCN